MSQLEDPRPPLVTAEDVRRLGASERIEVGGVELSRFHLGLVAVGSDRDSDGKLKDSALPRLASSLTEVASKLRAERRPS